MRVPGGPAAAVLPTAGIRSPAPICSIRGASQTYDFDISADQLAALNTEFHNLTALESGADFATYHPITFHLNGETVSNAQIKLHGQSSWDQTVQLDGDRAKMQFDVSFDQVDPMGAFHGVSKLVFDMPRDDWTFMHDRLSQAWLRQVGILAPCSASAPLNINGSYYGLYVLEQGVGNRTVAAFFPSNPMGDLWKGGVQAETNTASPNTKRLKMFDSAKDLSTLAAIMDIPDSLTSWAAEAMINDSDGYYNGSHNFYLYDQGAAGYVFLPQDTDSTWDWLATFDLPGAKDHPIYWWSMRAPAGADAGRQVAARPQRPELARALHRRDRKPARQMERGADPGVDRQLVAADRRCRRQRPARLGHCRPDPEGDPDRP